MKKISVLGSSGSIGVQALNMIAKTKGEFKVSGLTVFNNIELLKKQVIRFKPQAVSVNSESDEKQLKIWCKKNKLNTKVYSGTEGLIKVATLKETDMVLSAVVGSVGIYPLLEAINAGKDIAIANKEALVMAGSIIMQKAKEKNVNILPVDSEHSAIFQCIGKEPKKAVKRIIITASGGPFYRYKGDFSKITVADALNHPTWKMGKKITVDSATLMNKGLETIEASVLFGIPMDRIDIVIHPQSIVHSMVEFNDGCVMAQMSNPDMTLPIQYALSYPERKNCYIKPLDLTEISKLEFYKPDFKKFECLKIAYQCAKTGYTMPAVMSAANEVAVRAFLNGKITFDKIPYIVKKVVSKHKIIKTKNIKKYTESDIWARIEASELTESK